MQHDTRMVERLWMMVFLSAALFLGRPGWAADGALAQTLEPNTEAEESATDRPDEDAQDSATQTDPGTYVPPRWGAPRAKVGGGLRYGPQSTPGSLPVTMTLAPAQLARTVSPSPVLFWHIDSLPGPDTQLVFYLTDNELTDPVAEITLDTPQQPGIQRIDLAEHRVQLEPGIEYDWAVALVFDPKRRSRDIIANAYIQRVPELAGLSGTPPSFEQSVELGLWYDALAAISDAIEAAPDDVALREKRQRLLSQVGLGAAAEGSTQHTH